MLKTRIKTNKVYIIKRVKHLCIVDHFDWGVFDKYMPSTHSIHSARMACLPISSNITKKCCSAIPKYNQCDVLKEPAKYVIDAGSISWSSTIKLTRKMTPRLTASAVVFVVALVAMTSSTPNDQTKQPEAKGADIVEAVLDRLSTSCVFSDDKLFMRRLAYVESADGADPDTFRSGYFGGIWQVKRSAESCWAMIIYNTSVSGVHGSQ